MGTGGQSGLGRELTGKWGVGVREEREGST